MKRVLVDYMGGVCHIVCKDGDNMEDAVYVSNEFPVVVGPGASSKWVDAPDEVDQFWRLENGEWVDRSRQYTDPATARSVAYGSLGDQLDMIYKDMINGTNKWQDHIAKIKKEIPMDPDVLNDGRKEPIIHTVSEPSWSFLPNGGEEDVTI